MLKIDEDFLYVKSLFDLPEDSWNLEINDANQKVFSRKGLTGSLISIKSFTNVPNISKAMAFNVMTDINIRKTWDDALKDTVILENNVEDDIVTYYYTIPMPPFITTREALVQRKVLLDFPNKNDSAFHVKSVSHPSKPENPNKFVRLDVKAIGMFISDAPEINGCKLSWVFETDVKGNFPRSMVTSKSSKNVKIVTDAMAKAC